MGSKVEEGTGVFKENVLSGQERKQHTGGEQSRPAWKAEALLWGAGLRFPCHVAVGLQHCLGQVVLGVTVGFGAVIIDSGCWR